MVDWYGWQSETVQRAVSYTHLFLKIVIDVLHTGKNFNGSIFDEDVVNDEMCIRDRQSTLRTRKFWWIFRAYWWCGKKTRDHLSLIHIYSHRSFPRLSRKYLRKHLKWHIYDCTTARHLFGIFAEEPIRKAFITSPRVCLLYTSQIALFLLRKALLQRGCSR